MRCSGQANGCCGGGDATYGADANYGYSSDSNYAYDASTYGYSSFDSNYAYDASTYGYDANYAYDASTYGYSNANYGYSNANYGYSNANYGYFDSNYGYFDSNYGYFDSNYGYFNANYGYDSNYGYCIDSAPSSFTLSSPASSAVNQPTSLTLSWNPVSSWGVSCAGNSNTYTVRLEANDATPDNVLTTVGSGTTSALASGLTPNTLYYWRVIASNGALTSTTSTRSFTTSSCVDVAPAAVTLSSPANGATSLPQVVTLDWTDTASWGNYCAGNSTQYRIYLEANDATPDVLYGTTSAGVSALTTGSLSLGTTYYWLVSVANGAMVTNSSVSAFTVTNCANSAPAAPTLNSPANGASGQATNPTLDWSDVVSWGTNCAGNVNQYRVYLQQGVNPPSTLYTTLLSGTSQVTPVGLTQGATYYWRVESFNNALSAASPVYSFTVQACQNIAPAQSSLSAPANASANQPVSVSLQWGQPTSWGYNCAANTTQHQIILEANNPNPTTVVQSLASGSSSYTASGLIPGATYYWKVRNTNGALTNDSVVRSLSVCGNTTPSAPPLLSPADAATNQPVALSLDWSDVVTWGNVCTGNNNNYDVFFESGDTTPDVLVASYPSGTTIHPVSGLTPGATYYWLVRARNGANAFNSSTRSFTVQACQDSSPAIASVLLPANGSSQGTSPTLDWADLSSWGVNCAGNDNRYEVLLDQNPAPSTVVQTLGSAISQYTAGGLSYGSTYYWRIRTTNGALTNLSGIASFLVTACGNNLCDGSETAASCPQDCSCTWNSPLDRCGMNNACPACVSGHVKAYTGAVQAESAVKTQGAQVLSAQTDASGYYQFAPIDAGTYEFIALPNQPWTPSSVSRTIGLGRYIVNITVGQGDSSCREDCSKIGSGVCDATCQGTNGCLFVSEQTSSICHQRPVGASIAVGQTDQVLCCESEIAPKVNIKATATVNATNVYTVTRSVFFGGKLVKMKIVVFK